MRYPLRACMAVILLLAAAPVAAQSLTIRDLLALSHAGLSDEVLVALIEADQTVFDLGPYDVLDLRRQGLGDAVLVKMIKSRRPVPVPIPDPPAPRSPADTWQSGQSSREDREVRTRQAAPPVVVNQTVVQEVHVEQPRTRYVEVPVYVPIAVPVRPRLPEKEPEPVYWGFGGQRRPDSWKESKQDVTVPPKKTGTGGG